MMKDYFSHETATVDEDCSIGKDTKIWHYSHIMPGCTIGAKCNIGQNVFIASGVVLGNNVKIQNNVSLYFGVICDDDVFWDLHAYLQMSKIRAAPSIVKRNISKRILEKA